MANPDFVLLEQEAKVFLKKLLNEAVQIDEKKIDQLVNLFELVTIKKNQIIIEEGEIADSFYFIYSGIIKVYFYKNEKPVIERFEKEGGFFGGNFTHVTKIPGTHVYESIEDLILLKINYKELDKLCRASHDIERLYRINLELFHSNYVKRLTTLKSASTKVRYNEFVHEYSDIANRVSLKDIANFLDMTSETISRIRGKSIINNQL